MYLLDLCGDVIVYICSFLNDKEKLTFLSLNKYLQKFLHKVWFKERYFYHVIQHLSYKDQFKRIVLEELVEKEKLPKSLYYIEFFHLILIIPS